MRKIRWGVLSAAKIAINEMTVDVCDQYTIQGDLFAKAVLEDGPVPTPLEDALANMQAIEALLCSARRGTWVQPA